MIKAGIIGATGYAGAELVRILSQHPEVNSLSLGSKSYEGKEFASLYQNFHEIVQKTCDGVDFGKIAGEVDALFLALPHGIASNEMNEKVLNATKVIDLGADFRLGSHTQYEDWYNVPHGSPDLIAQAVYGLSEWNRNAIKTAKLIANPGCYPTASLLGLLPLVKDNLISSDGIVIDAKSGVSGAGRSLNLASHFCECYDSIKAYKIGTHRHTPEIEEQLSHRSGKQVTLTFTPHLVPMNRGILTTTYAQLNSETSIDEVKNSYRKYYGREKFIRLLPSGRYPETKWVKGSNYCDIGAQIDPRTGKIIIISAIDNMVKGAAGQAVQNMNLMNGFEEDTGLNQIPIFPS